MSNGAAPARSSSTSGEPGLLAGVPPARLFAADSIWNAPLDARAPLDPRSAQLATALQAEVRDEVRLGIGPWISETSYSTPVYTVAAEQPRVHVQLDAGGWARSLQDVLDRSGVPIPSNAEPANGTDGHLTIYQPASDSLWEFWQARKKPDGWHASWGGAMHTVSDSPGYYSDQAWSGLGSGQGWNWGATATSLPVAGGLIRIDELRRQRIDHALALAIPAPCAHWFSWPAQRTDGYSDNAQCLPEGAHLRIDPTLDLSKLNLPVVTRVMAEAAQRYGMIVRDKTGHATGFYAEDPRVTGGDPYHGVDGLYSGLAPWKFLPQFPWNRLQVLKLTPCSAAPCRPPSAAAAARLQARAPRRRGRPTRRRHGRVRAGAPARTRRSSPPGRARAVVRPR